MWSVLTASGLRPPVAGPSGGAFGAAGYAAPSVQSLILGLGLGDTCLAAILLLHLQLGLHRRRPLAADMGSVHMRGLRLRRRGEGSVFYWSSIAGGAARWQSQLTASPLLRRRSGMSRSSKSKVKLKKKDSRRAAGIEGGD